MCIKRHGATFARCCRRVDTASVAGWLRDSGQLAMVGYGCVRLGTDAYGWVRLGTDDDA